MRKLIPSPLPKEDCPAPVSRHLDIWRKHYQKDSFGRPQAKRRKGSACRGGRRVTRGNHHTCSGNSIIQNLTAQNQKILLSREHRLFSGLTVCSWCWGCTRQFWSWRWYATGVEMQAWAVVGDVYLCKYIVILGYFYSKLHLGIVGHFFSFLKKIFAFFRSRIWKKTQNFLLCVDSVSRHHTKGFLKLMIYDFFHVKYIDIFNKKSWKLFF